MKILSWNVNGLRAVLKKGFLDFLEKEKPDILGIQEIKIDQQSIIKEEISFAGYEVFWNPAQRPGYSGTALLINSKIFKKNSTAIVRNGFGQEKFDKEGRWQCLELDNFYLANIYFPNSGPELIRLDYKLAFDEKVLFESKKNSQKKPIILMGDFNVAHQEIDIARPKENKGSAGFTLEERNWMTKFLSQGFIDSWRFLNPKEIQYTWWSYRAQARARNVGWRLDYCCYSQNLKNKVKKALVEPEIFGSDHCPVGLEILEK